MHHVRSTAAAANLELILVLTPVAIREQPPMSRSKIFASTTLLMTMIILIAILGVQRVEGKIKGGESRHF